MISEDEYHAMFGAALHISQSTQQPQESGEYLRMLQTVLRKRSANGLELQEAAALLKAIGAKDDSAKRLVIQCAAVLRERIFGVRVAVMAPLEIGSYCASNCTFCGWRKNNRQIQRYRIAEEGLIEQVDYLVGLGIRHIELSGGDDLYYLRHRLAHTIQQIKTHLAARGIAVRLSICMTPMHEQHYRVLKESGLDAVLTWQESYDQSAFNSHITEGPKAFGIDADLRMYPHRRGFIERMQSQERALRCGLQVGVGHMLGLSEHYEAEILATILHARLLLSKYPHCAPIIMGMPLLCQAPNQEQGPCIDGTNSFVPTEDFVFVAAVYLLSLPDYRVWIFPNCRVPMDTQMAAIATAGCFTSTEVSLVPGGYLQQAVIGSGAFEKTSKSGSGTLSRNRLLQGEQFQHEYHGHQAYIATFRTNGMQIVHEQDLLVLGNGEMP